MAFQYPSTPHHGGAFAALIKSTKRALESALQNTGLKHEELQTAMTEVEAILNSRPLTYPGDDPRDEPTLTPNHFLYGQAKGLLMPSGEK